MKWPKEQVMDPLKLDEAIRTMIIGLVGIGWDPRSAVSFVLSFHEC